MLKIFEDVIKLKAASKPEREEMIRQNPCLAPFDPDYYDKANAILRRYDKMTHEQKCALLKVVNEE